MPVKKRKRIKRKAGKSTLYFSAETQQAIHDFRKCEEQKDREKIYRDLIFPAFDKLAENLIFVYGFINPGDQYQTLKSDCVSFLFETLNKWDESRGTKAFSYFNVVAKNWLIAHARKTRKKSQRNVSIHDETRMSPDDRLALASFEFMPSPDEFLHRHEFRQEIYDTLNDIEKKVRGEKETACISAIKTVFENVDNLDFLNKRAIFVYVRDISGLNPKQLSVAMSSIRKHYREIIRKRRLR